MIVLRTQPRVLMPVPQWEWREPSRAQPKDAFGRGNTTRFKIELWRRDGGLLDQQWFDDRAEFDYALWDRAISEPWEDVATLFAVVTTLTSPTGSLQTYNKPSDWDNATNTVECIGGGGSGGNANKSPNTQAAQATGGSGAGYGRKANITIVGSTNYQISPTAAAIVTTTATALAGNNGGDTWFGATVVGSAPVAGRAGTGGKAQNAANTALSGIAAGGSGIGDAITTGGGAGSIIGDDLGRMASGGGGGAGRNGNGVASINVTLDAIRGEPGGAGDAGLGGAGGTGITGGTTSGNGGPGGNGTNYNGAGAGGGGGGSSQGTSTACFGGNAGNYGGGGGGAVGGGTSPNALGITSGTGGQGIIWITYTPYIPPPAGMMLMFP